MVKHRENKVEGRKERGEEEVDDEGRRKQKDEKKR